MKLGPKTEDRRAIRSSRELIQNTSASSVTKGIYFWLGGESAEIPHFLLPTLHLDFSGGRARPRPSRFYFTLSIFSLNSGRTCKCFYYLKERRKTGYRSGLLSSVSRLPAFLTKLFHSPPIFHTFLKWTINS
ncbi:hypothetical protein LV85_03468 [Algoriphagus chordae]|uniref:Uncharacterized protein n=1 Tax=Algoriphagus chordae TaxID=237019 RepID=A0A2W7QJL1_9BACT|nr:hypothetical protein LV85_03468 [Algoriphagus chordae]